MHRRGNLEAMANDLLAGPCNHPTFAIGAIDDRRWTA